MVVKSYETACSSCHDNQIKAKSAAKTGIPFIGIPRMDDRTLTGDNSIGEWPEDADQPLTPFLQLILSSEPQLREALGKLQGVDLSNLPKADSEKLKAAQTLAWGIKSLILDLGSLGQDELIRRINLCSGHTLTDYEQEGIVAFLNADALRSTFRTAFPNLQKEVLDYRKKGKAAPTQLIPSPELPAAGQVKNVSPDVWVSQGGWYSPDGTFTLYYHPRGHRDRFLSSWMDLTVDDSHALDPAISRALFKTLSEPKAVGLCSKCHSIDDKPAKRVNWVGSRPDPLEHEFNRFSHSAHLSLLDARGCFTCHTMKLTGSQTKDTYASAFEPGHQDPSQFQSNFRTIDKAVCANCHQPSLVRDDCLLCHNYHIGRFKPVIPHATIAARPQPIGN
jgi:cytochrome c553